MLGDKPLLIQYMFPEITLIYSRMASFCIASVS